VLLLFPNYSPLGPEGAASLNDDTDDETDHLFMSIPCPLSFLAQIPPRYLFVLKE
jgi:hypothetical protein